MTALTRDRNTPIRTGDEVSHPVAAGVVIHAGALVCLNAAGNAVPGALSLTLTAIGMAEREVNNVGGLDGALSIKVRRGVIRLENEPTDLCNRTHIGKTAYIVDDQTVAATNGVNTRSAAGKIIDLDADGVWVEIR